MFNHKIRHVCEYAAVRGLAGLLQLLPYAAALGVGWVVARSAFSIGRFRVAEAVHRIREIFPDLTEAEARRMAWHSWRNFVFSGVELMRMPVMPSHKVKQIVEMNGIEKILEHLRSGRGAIIATLHMGSWEMAAMTALAYGIPLFSLAARQKNLLVDAYMNRLRGQTGFETVLRDVHAARAILRRIKDGKALAILPDVRSRSPGISVKFLGRTANIAEGMGMIAHQTNVPIFPCVITRRGWSRHYYRVFDPVHPESSMPKTEDAARLTQAVFDVFDRCVRAEPEQWFWFNKRWLFDPLSDDVNKASATNNNQE